MNRMWQLHITQHKRFVPNSTHLNFCFAKTSFMLGTSYEMAVEYESMTKLSEESK